MKIFKPLISSKNFLYLSIFIVSLSSLILFLFFKSFFILFFILPMFGLFFTIEDSNFFSRFIYYSKKENIIDPDFPDIIITKYIMPNGNYFFFHKNQLHSTLSPAYSDGINKRYFLLGQEIKEDNISDLKNILKNILISRNF